MPILPTFGGCGHFLDLGRAAHIIETYDKSEKGAKSDVTACIVHLVKEEVGRFLKGSEDEDWVEGDEAAARAKVDHAFRNRRKMFQTTLNRTRALHEKCRHLPGKSITYGCCGKSQFLGAWLGLAL
jgi:hypothetical protein